MRRKDINRAFYQRVSDIPEDADVITIFGSGNDLSSDQTLGNVTDTGTDTICGCINATIDAIYERIPLARLGIVTPTPWVGSKDYRKPMVWTFHDCWPFTGHCPFYTLASCNKWKTGYFKCPKHKDYPMSYIDDSKFQYNLKKEYFLELRILQLLLFLIGWQMKLRNLFLGGIIRLSSIME